MKDLIYKIALGFIAIISLLFLVFYSFFGTNNKKDFNNNFDITKIGIKTSSSFVMDKINFYTTIYSNKKDYKIEKNNIKLGTGVYLIDSRDVFSSFSVFMGETKVIISGAGLVYINNTKHKNIFSLNNKIKIEFSYKNKITKKYEKGVVVYLYPHMYLKPKLPVVEKKQKLDAYLVSNYGFLNYYNGTFEDLLDKDNFVIETQNKDFFNKTIKNIISNQEKYSKQLENFKNSNFFDKKIIIFLEKYFSIFYNDRKKVIYYQNKVLYNLYALFYKKDDKQDINKIIKNLEKIKNIDENEYKKIFKLLKNIYFLVSYDLSKNSNIAQNNFDNLFSKLLKIKDTRKIKIIKDVDRYNYFGDFSKYLKLLSKNIELLDISLKKEKSKQEEYLELLSKQYYNLFKQKVLIQNFSKNTIEERNFVLLIDGLISYANSIEKNIEIGNNDVEESYILNVISNYKLLKQLKKTLRNRFFEEKRDSQNLLVFRKNIVKIQKIKELKEAIDILFNKFRKSKDIILNDKNYENQKEIIAKYLDIIPKFREYITALEDYSIYKKKYSKVNKALLGVEVYKDENDEKLTKQKFINFISKFSGIDYSSVDLEVFNNYYKVNNISINGRNFAFDLYPNKGNLIKNIVYKNNGVYESPKQRGFYNFLESTSYSLDEQKEKYKKLFEKAKQEEKEKYNFNRFFINSFFMKTNVKKEDFKDSNEKTNNDDEIIQTFKRSKILGPNGEFKKIRDFLKLNYFNLEVKRGIDNNFTIKINNAKIFYTDDKNRKYEIIFNANYKLTNKYHYFYNIKLKFFTIFDSSNKKETFPGIKFKFRGTINIFDFKNEILKIFSKLEDIKQDYNKQKNNKNMSSITYNIFSGKYYIK